MICFRLLDSKDPAQPLADAVQALAQNNASKDTYEVEPKSFRHIPNAPFAYWVSEKVRKLFVTLPSVENEQRTAKLGVSSKDDFRYLRLTWECPMPRSANKWALHVKGGSYSPYYADVHLLINWLDNARELEADLLQKYPYLGDSAEFVLHMKNPYFREGLTWPLRTQSGLALRAMPRECVFANKGPALFNYGDSDKGLPHLLALTSSSSFKSLVALQMAFGSYEVGVIQRTVIPEKNDEQLPILAKHAWSNKRNPDTANLTSHAFVAPALSPRAHTI